jgi:hypothetical protein
LPSQHLTDHGHRARFGLPHGPRAYARAMKTTSHQPRAHSTSCIACGVPTAAAGIVFGKLGVMSSPNLSATVPSAPGTSASPGLLKLAKDIFAGTCGALSPSRGWPPSPGLTHRPLHRGHQCNVGGASFRHIEGQASNTVHGEAALRCVTHSIRQSRNRWLTARAHIGSWRVGLRQENDTVGRLGRAVQGEASVLSLTLQLSAMS